MFIFNKLVNEFIKKQKKRISEFCRECRLPEYDLKIVIFDRGFKGTQTIGFFDMSQKLIGLHQSLMLESQERIDKVLKHEYAHFLTEINHGKNVQSHGKDFAFFCQRLGISAEAVEKDPLYHERIEKNDVIEKVKKLLNLSSSSNEHESQLATAKANQLLTKYNLSLTNLEETDDVYMRIVAQEKKANTYIQELCDLMRAFHVYPVIVSRNHRTYLEISGNKVNVEIAHYIADYFSNEYARLWNLTKKEKNLKGLAAKNSFIRGLVEGYCSQIRKIQSNNFNEDEIRSLTVQHAKMKEKTLKTIYPKLKTFRFGGGQDSDAFNSGFEQGKQMKFNPAVSSDSDSKKLLS